MKRSDILVCIIGSLHGGDLARETLLAHVLHPLKADLAVLQAYNTDPYKHATHV